MFVESNCVKQALINENNERENKNRKEYHFKVGQQVLIEQVDAKYAADPWKDPYCLR